jgi:hypothetical protein
MICNFCKKFIKREYPNVYGYYCVECGNFNDPDSEFPINNYIKENKAKRESIKNIVINKIKGK